MQITRGKRVKQFSGITWRVFGETRDRFLKVEAPCNCAIAENAIEKHGDTRDGCARRSPPQRGILSDGQIIIGARYRAVM